MGGDTVSGPSRESSNPGDESEHPDGGQQTEWTAEIPVRHPGDELRTDRGSTSSLQKPRALADGMVEMKQVGSCEHCSKGGALEMVEVTEVGKSAPVVHLYLCGRCAVMPNSVWRRRYQPVPVGAGPCPS
jgi:hypothetical protein